MMDLLITLLMVIALILTGATLPKPVGWIVLGLAVLTLVLAFIPTVRGAG